MTVELTVLVDNQAGREDLRTEHGLSILITGPGRKLLLDTGQEPETLMHNARVLSADLASTAAVVISHGHYDHTGGLARVLSLRDRLDLYAHPGAFLRRWVQRPGVPLKDISCPHSLEKLCQAGAVFHAIGAPERIEPWLVLTGPIGGPKFGQEQFVIRKNDQIVPDWFEDELAVLLRGRRGWVVVTGCCHRGLHNTLKTARFVVHGEPIVAVVGGLHLRSCDNDALRAVVSMLGQFGNPGLYPCHCTGQQTMEFLSRKLGDQFHPIQAGSVLRF